MHPANLPCLAAARPDACELANNHVMDFGLLGLAETLDTLAVAELTAVGAGWDAGTAREPAIVTLDGGQRILVFAFGTASSGIPWRWAAAEDRPGVDFVSEASDVDAADVVDRVRQARRPGDVVVASIHWGSNWGHQVSRDQTLFAHALIDGGVDVVYGHSSHHPRPIEVYQGKPVLYGCGDFIDDYEGITGHEHYRDDLRLLYFISVEPSTGRLVDARMTPVQARKIRLEHACAEDAQWLREVLERVSRGFDVRIDLGPDGMLTLRSM
jgi:poly-gamma-glutamate synthesis protein (capsule biosynthesis protein)